MMYDYATNIYKQKYQLLVFNDIYLTLYLYLNIVQMIFFWSFLVSTVA